MALENTQDFGRFERIARDRGDPLTSQRNIVAPEWNFDREEFRVYTRTHDTGYTTLSHIGDRFFPGPALRHGALGGGESEFRFGQIPAGSLRTAERLAEKRLRARRFVEMWAERRQSPRTQMASEPLRQSRGRRGNFKFTLIARASEFFSLSIRQ